MKRSAMLFLSCLMIFTAACGAKPAGTEAVQQAVSEEPQTQSAAQGHSLTEAAEKSEISKVTIDETVLYEQNQVKITAREMYYDSDWDELGVKVLIENGSDKDLNISCNDPIVNNYMVMDYFSCFVAAGKKANDIIDLPAHELRACGIEAITDIVLNFEAGKANSYDVLFETGEIQIKTSAYGTVEQPDMAGQALYDQDGIRITAKYAEDSYYWDKAILVFIENNYGRDIRVRCENASINEFMVDLYLHREVYNGRRAFDYMRIYSEDLEKNDIESFEEIELVFEIEDSKTYKTIAKTQPVFVSVKDSGGAL